MAWNRPSSGDRPVVKPKKPSAMRGVIAGLAVVAIAGACIFLFMGKDEKPVEKNAERKPTSIKEVAPVAAPKAVAVAPKAATEGTKAEKLPEWKDEYIRDSAMRLKFSKLIMARTNESGLVTERFSLPNGKTWRRVTDPPPIFENRCDMAIVRALGDASGAPIPPVPGLDDADLDQEFANSLLSPIVIKDDDKPSIAALKMMVKQTRAQIAEIIKSGDSRSVGEILQDHINLNNRNADMQADAIRQYNKVREDEGDEFAAEYLKKVNETLAGYGVDPIRVDTGDGDADSAEETKEEGEKR